MASGHIYLSVKRVAKMELVIVTMMVVVRLAAGSKICDSAKKKCNNL